MDPPTVIEKEKENALKIVLLGSDEHQHWCLEM